MRCEHKRVNARCSLCDEMTTDDRIEAIAKYHPGNEGSIAWLIAELRRAREALLALQKLSNDWYFRNEDATEIYRLTKRGLGDE